MSDRNSELILYINKYITKMLLALKSYKAVIQSNALLAAQKK